MVFTVNLIPAETLEAGSGDEAIAILKAAKNPFDLVISDVVMANGDGKKVLEFVRTNCPQTRFMFMSGFAELTEQEAVQLGRVLFLKSPLIQKILRK